MVPIPHNHRPRVVIVGGGFGGLYAARALRHADCSITVVDRRNHHLFQPLLYQVATATLSPAQIAAPIRRILRRQKNVSVLLGDAVGIDAPSRTLKLTDGTLGYDYLILACGATHSYFGNDSWSPLAPGLKTVEDALEIRRRFLLAFEAAERESDREARRAELTFVVVGGGPTGVEMAGAMIEIARSAIPRDFRSANTASATVILVEAGPRVLPAFPEVLSARAKKHLEELGVEVRVNCRVTNISPAGVQIGDQTVKAGNVIWAAGVQASPLGAALPAERDRSGRVIVGPDLTIPNHPEIFIVGDMAAHTNPSGEPTPGLCPAAVQMGQYAAKIITAECRARAASPAQRPPFKYLDKGILATIGRNRAVAALAGMKVGGFIAWVLWAFVHILLLIGFRNRLIVMLDWSWTYFFFDRGARLITGDATIHLGPGSTAGSAPSRGA